MSRLFLSMTVALTILGPALGQSLPELLRFVEPPHGGLLNPSPIGDLDGDGLDEIGLIFTVGPSFSSPTRPSFFIHSSTGVRFDVERSFAPLVTSGPVSASRFYPLADLDGDGAEDFAAYFTTVSGFRILGVTQIRSGLTNTVLSEFLNVSEPILALAGDRNGDGVSELLISDREVFSIGSDFPARVDLIDGATFSRTRLVDLPQNISTSGLFEVGDVNLDGVQDFAIGSGAFQLTGNDEGAVAVVSGLDGSAIQSWVGLPLQQFGSRIERLDDVDGDGRSDILVFARGVSSAPGPTAVGEVLAISSLTGATLFRIPSLGVGFEQIADNAPTGDVNGDGFVDFKVVIQETVPGMSTTRHELRSGQDGSFLTDIDQDDIFVGDLSGDLNSDFVSVSSTPAQPLTLPPLFESEVIAETFVGGLSYGTGSIGRRLVWNANAAIPQVGQLRFEGALPNAPLVTAVSFAPANTVIAGTSLPLLVSLTALDLLIADPDVADASGAKDYLVSLHQPALAGLILYFQVAEVGASVGTSNGVELLFSDF